MRQKHRRMNTTNQGKGYAPLDCADFNPQTSILGHVDADKVHHMQRNMPHEAHLVDTNALVG